MVTHNGGVGFSARIARRTILFVNQGVSYTPASLYGLFASVSVPAPGDTIPGNTDYYTTSSKPTLTYATTARLTQNFGRRDTLLFSYDLQYTDAAETGPLASRLKYYDVGGTWTHPLSTGVGLRAGYTYRSAQYSQTVRANEKDIDLGIDYNRPLSRSRRTTLGFSVGSAADSALLQGINAAEVRQQYRLLVNASLTHRMGRTWSLKGSYQRQAGFVAGLVTPMYGNATTLKAEGVLSRRVSLTMTGAATTGDSFVNSSTGGVSSLESSRFTTYTGDVQMNVTIRREWAGAPRIPSLLLHCRPGHTAHSRNP